MDGRWLWLRIQKRNAKLGAIYCQTVRKLLRFSGNMLSLHLMAILKKNAFSRRVPDLVTEELVAVLSRRTSFEFKQLFEILHENLRARNAASGGEEMLRLRAYEKLQNLVARGMVKRPAKNIKAFPQRSQML